MNGHPPPPVLRHTQQAAACVAHTSEKTSATPHARVIFVSIRTSYSGDLGLRSPPAPGIDYYFQVVSTSHGKKQLSLDVRIEHAKRKIETSCSSYGSVAIIKKHQTSIRPEVSKNLKKGRTQISPTRADPLRWHRADGRVRISRVDCRGSWATGGDY